MKISLDSFNRRFQWAKERTTELENWSIEIIQFGEPKEERMKKNE